ncbi:MAG: glycoside hydrolase family 43 protein, partial [Flavitalea sp.]
MLALINRLTRKSYLTLLLNVLTIFPTSSQQLVLPGDYPDPSVTKIGDTYWATATSSNWFPAYPLLKSKDLINWEPQGYIFDTMPQWSDYYFWAPEISYENGKVYVYYSAHKKNGNLCIGVASA